MFGPLFAKELLTLSRQRRMFALRSAAAGLMLLALAWNYLVLAGWIAAVSGAGPAPGQWVTLPNGVRYFQPNQGIAVQWATTRTGVRYPVANPLYAEGVDSNLRLIPHALRTTGLTVAAWWALGGAAFVFAFTPMLLAGVVAGERRNRTLETLFTTHLTSREILFGKAAGRMLPIATALLASVPPLAFANYFGGFTAVQIGWSAALLAALACAVAGLTMAASASSTGALPALFRTYFALALCAAAFFGVLAFPTFFPPGFVVAAERMEPFGCLRQCFFEDAARPFAPGPPLVGYAAIGLLLAWHASRNLRRAIDERPPWLWRAAAGAFHGTVAGLRRGLAVVKGPVWRLQLASERRVARQLARLADRQPLVYRHRVANIYDPQRWIALLQWLPAVVALAASMAFAAFGGFGGYGRFETTIHWTFGAATWLQPVCVLLLGAGAWARERQALSWDALRLASLPASAHMFAALQGIFRTMWPGLLLLAAGFPLALVGGSSDAAALANGVALAAQLAMLAVGGLLASSACERVGEALACAFVPWCMAFVASLLPRDFAALPVVPPLAALACGGGLLLLAFGGRRTIAWGMPLLYAAALVALKTMIEPPRDSSWLARPDLGAGPLSLRNFPQPYWMADGPTAWHAAIAALAVAFAGLLALLRTFDRFAAAEPRRRPAAA